MREAAGGPFEPSLIDGPCRPAAPPPSETPRPPPEPPEPNEPPEPRHSPLARVGLLCFTLLIVYASLYPFSGWKGSFYGDLHVHGSDGVDFYTRKKMVISRW